MWLDKQNKELETLACLGSIEMDVDQETLPGSTQPHTRNFESDDDLMEFHDCQEALNELWYNNHADAFHSPMGSGASSAHDDADILERRTEENSDLSDIELPGHSLETQNLDTDTEMPEAAAGLWYPFRKKAVRTFQINEFPRKRLILNYFCQGFDWHVAHGINAKPSI